MWDKLQARPSPRYPNEIGLPEKNIFCIEFIRPLILPSDQLRDQHKIRRDESGFNYNSCPQGHNWCLNGRLCGTMTTGTDTHDTPTEHLPGTISCRVAYKERTITSPVSVWFNGLPLLRALCSVINERGPIVDRGYRIWTRLRASLTEWVGADVRLGTGFVLCTGGLWLRSLLFGYFCLHKYI